MYEVLDQQKSTYLAAFKDIYADVEAGTVCPIEFLSNQTRSITEDYL